jgi:nucleoredoxin
METQWQIELFCDKIWTKDGEKDTMSVLEGKQFVAVYFSAHWCPPCRQFTPVLGAFYDQ